MSGYYANSSQQQSQTGASSSNHNNHSQPVQQARRGRAPFSRRGLFQRDLRDMMYGFGDVQDPLPETITVMEDLLIDYITNLCVSAHGVSTNRGKLKLDDVRFALRKPQHTKQLARVEELLVLEKEIKKARSLGEDNLADYAREDYGADDEEAGDGQGSPAKKKPKPNKQK